MRSVYWDGLSDDLLESIQTDVAPNFGVVALWFLGYALVTQQLRQQFYLRKAREWFGHVVFHANVLHAWSRELVVHAVLS